MQNNRLRRSKPTLSVVSDVDLDCGPIPCFKPAIGEAEIEAVISCLRSGWLTSGPVGRQFESDFAHFVGGGVEAVAVSSATEGLEIALTALGIGEGDEVITTDYTFSATALCIARIGARVVLVDIDPITFNIDPARVEAAITPRTKAIIPVHFAGLPCDLKALNDIARRHGLRVIEDAAHAFPAKSDGRMIGQNSSDATVFSFYATKTLTTGEGGMITFGDPAIAARARRLRLHGIDRDAYLRTEHTAADWRYDVVEPGFKANLSDLLASIGIVQLRRAWALHEQRAQIWANYDDALVNLPLTLPPKGPAGDIHAMHLYAIRLTKASPFGRDEFIRQMRERGIICSVHFIPLHEHTYWRRALDISAADFPASQDAFECEVTLPLFPEMKPAQQRRIISAVQELLGG